VRSPPMPQQTNLVRTVQETEPGFRLGDATFGERLLFFRLFSTQLHDESCGLGTTASPCRDRLTLAG
jgi:hypothetical protein